MTTLSLPTPLVVSRLTGRWLVVGLIGAALVVSAVAGYRPTYAALLLVAGVALVVAVARPEWAMLGLVAAFALQWSFGDKDSSAAASLPKLVGGLTIGGFALRLLLERRRLRWDDCYLPVLALLATFAFSSTAAISLGAGLATTVRLAMFAAFFVVLTQVLDRRWVVPVMGVMVAATTLAVLLAIPPYLAEETYQLRPPAADPNDFGAVMATALVLDVALLRSPSRRLRLFGIACGAVLLVGLGLCFSRGSLLALVAALLILLVTAPTLRRTLGRVLLVGVLVAIPVAVVMWAQITESLGRKANVAGDNVGSRFEAWTLAIQLAQQHPLTGVGPGNFGYYTHAMLDIPSQAFAVEVVHNTHLDVLVYGGLPALCAWAALLAVAVLRLRRAARSPAQSESEVALVLLAGLVAMVVAACFSTQLFNGSFWLLLGLAMVTGRTAAPLPGGRR